MRDLKARAKEVVGGLKRSWRSHRNRRAISETRAGPGLVPVEPIWPLTRHPAGPSDDEIRPRFAVYPQWHHAYRFAGGLDFPVRLADPLALALPPGYCRVQGVCNRHESGKVPQFCAR
jgi:hypothetical protein